MPNAQPVGGKGQKGKGGNGGKGQGGGGVGKSGGGAQPGDWPCHICGAKANRDWRERCRSCQSYRSIDMERALAAHAQKQAQQQRRGSQQQQQQQRQQQQRQQVAKNDDDRRLLRQRVENLQAELAAVKAAQSSRPCDADVDAEADDLDDEGGYAAWSEEERTKRVELAKGGLAYAIAAFGEESAEAQKLRDEIGALQRASREAKPFKAHRNQLERRRDELRRKQERDEAAVAAAQAEISELQSKVSTLQSTIEERARQLKQVVDELNELVRKSLAEGGDGEEEEGGRAAPSQTSAPWTALAAAASGLVGQPGVPAEVGALLAQLQHVAGAFISNAAAAQAKPASSGPAAEGAAPATASAPAAEAKPKATSPGVPVALAPHGRFSRATAKNPCPSPPRQLPATPPAAAGMGVGGGNNAGDGAAVVGAAAGAATSADPAGTTAPTAVAAIAARPESKPALLENGSGDDDAMVVDLETSLALLPEPHQRKLRAAIRSGEDRGRAQADEEAVGSRRDERERSPRPTKLNDGDV